MFGRFRSRGHGALGAASTTERPWAWSSEYWRKRPAGRGAVDAEKSAKLLKISWCCRAFEPRCPAPSFSPVDRLPPEKRRRGVAGRGYTDFLSGGPAQGL